MSIFNYLRQDIKKEQTEIACMEKEEKEESLVLKKL
jgi:hypothetical protein